MRKYQQFLLILTSTILLCYVVDLSLAQGIIITIFCMLIYWTLASKGEKKQMGVFKKVATGGGLALGAVGYLIVGLGGIAIHLWTVLIAYSYSGFIPALVAFVTPVFAQAYWIYRVSVITGTLFNSYSFAIAIYILAWVMLMIIYGLFEKLAKGNDHESNTF